MTERKIIQTNFNPGRGGKTPQYVIMHTYGGKGRSLYAYFNKASSQVSAHYAVFKDGNSEQYVELWDTAWHAGVFSVNQESIGIEHQDDGNPDDAVRTDALYEESARLIADIYKRYNWDVNNSGLIKLHREFVPTRSCPGGLDIARIRQRVYDLLHMQDVIIYYIEMNGVQIPVLYQEKIDPNALQKATSEFHSLRAKPLLDRETLRLIKLNQTKNTVEVLGDARGEDNLEKLIEEAKTAQQVSDEFRTELAATKEALRSANNSNLLLKDDNKRKDERIAELEKNAGAKFTQLIGPLYIKQ